ncbi:MAG: hypothetical protein ACI31G_02895 [Bacilli bacterium]
MKEKIKNFYHKYELNIYLSIIASLIIFTIHLVKLIIKFDKIIFSYFLFSFLIVTFKIMLLIIYKKKIKVNIYFLSFIFVIILLLPMIACFTWTILIKEYVYDYFAYVYGAYGIIKFIFAIKGIIKSHGKKGRDDVLAYLNLIVSFYTIMMMEYRLIMFITEGVMTKSSRAILLNTQGAIVIFTIYVIFRFYKYSQIKKLVT